MPRRYELVSSTGTRQLVFDLIEDDFDAAMEESLQTGVKHRSVTLDPSGCYPSFPCPESQLRELQGTP